MNQYEQRLEEEGIRGQIYLFKNNTDSAGNSYGCHENYLIERKRRTADESDFFKGIIKFSFFNFTKWQLPISFNFQVFAIKFKEMARR